MLPTKQINVLIVVIGFSLLTNTAHLFSAEYIKRKRITTFHMAVEQGHLHRATMLFNTDAGNRTPERVMLALKAVQQCCPRKLHTAFRKSPTTALNKAINYIGICYLLFHHWLQPDPALRASVIDTIQNTLQELWQEFNEQHHRATILEKFDEQRHEALLKLAQLPH